MTDKLSNIQLFGMTPEDHARFEAAFYNLPIFKADEAEPLSFREVYNDTSAVEQRVFRLYDPEVEGKEVFESGHRSAKYVRFKFIFLNLEDQERLLI
mmetsp:Transcript_17648/g.27304  ORF Transcript_17648/g.27304 Transcript_17648/m.27304 type:complete len:97 (-) Transcript_17648:79-369(-)